MERSFEFLRKNGITLEHSGVFTLVIRKKSVIGMLRVYSAKPFKIIVNERDIETPDPKEVLSSLSKFADAKVPKRNLFSNLFSNEAFAQSNRDLTIKENAPVPENLDNYREIVVASVQRAKTFYILGEFKNPNPKWYDSEESSYYTGRVVIQKNGLLGPEVVTNPGARPHDRLKSRYQNLRCSPNKSDQGVVVWRRNGNPKDPPLVMRGDVLRMTIGSTESDIYGVDVRLRATTPQEAVKFSKMKGVPEPEEMHRLFVAETKLFSQSKNVQNGKALPSKMTTDELEKAVAKWEFDSADYMLLKAFSICCLDEVCRRDLRKQGVEFSLTSEPVAETPSASSSKPEPSSLIKVNGDVDLRDPRYSPDVSF